MRKFMNMISEAMNEDLTTEDIETVIRYIDCDGPVKIGFGNFERQWLPSVIAHKMLGDGWESFIRTNLPAAREFEASRQKESYEYGKAAAPEGFVFSPGKGWVPPHLA